MPARRSSLGKTNAEFCVPHVDHPAPQHYSSQRSDPENTGSVGDVSTRTDLPTTLKSSADFFFQKVSVCVKLGTRNTKVLRSVKTLQHATLVT